MINAPFASLSEFRTVLRDLPCPDAAAAAAAGFRNSQLTKPLGALGRLEELAIWYAGWRGIDRPAIEQPQIIVFAGNHGVAAQGISAFPASVTAQMVANFRAGGAAINQLARTFGAKLDVEAFDLDHPTADFTMQPAMTEDQVVSALAQGWDAVDAATDLLVVGEMGIGNTTVAAAVAAGLFGGDATHWVGRGTGVDDGTLSRKIDVVNAGLKLHSHAVSDPLQVLRCLGGFELAAMAGAIARAHAERVPVILDGFICTAAAAVLECCNPGSLDHAVAGHLSAEGAHGRLLGLLGKPPLLSLDLRLGEGSGAALAIGILQGAVACHSRMATFAEAGVSAG